MSGSIAVLDRGRPVSFSFEELLRYSGPGSPGGLALGFKAIERGLSLLDPGTTPERREVTVETAFRGPGARDAFELITRAVTDGRYAIVPALARCDRGPALERFVFRLGYRRSAVTLVLRDGYVSDEFIALARTQTPSAGQSARLDLLKRELSDRAMASTAEDVWEAGEQPDAERPEALAAVPGLVLRPLAAADAAELRRIHATPEVARWWDDPAGDFPMTDEPESTRLTIEVDGAVAGLIQYWEEREPKYRHAGIDVFLDPAASGRGIGTEAVRRVVRHLIDERGHHRITIDPATANRAAIRCYEKAGFAAVGVMRRSERDADGEGWHDRLLMELLAGEE